MADGRTTLRKYLHAALVLPVSNFEGNVNPNITSFQVDLHDEYTRPPCSTCSSRLFDKDTLKLLLPFARVNTLSTELFLGILYTVGGVVVSTLLCGQRDRGSNPCGSMNFSNLFS